MSVVQIENMLLQLSREERRQFARWFYDHENEFFTPESDEEISPELQAEIMRRRDQALAHPELLEPWEGTTDSLRAQLNEIRRQLKP